MFFPIISYIIFCIWGRVTHHWGNTKTSIVIFYHLKFVNFIFSSIIKTLMALPEFLLDRYRDWKRTIDPLDKKFYLELEKNTQEPKLMIISCCDSRECIKYF